MSHEKKVILIERVSLVAVGTLLLCLAISGASIWIDEALSEMLAAQPTLASWASTLDGMQGSEPQMPGYLIYLWGWARLFGVTEWSLRLANLPWALLFTASLAWGSEYLLGVRRWWLIICLSPFVWLYMNEARPYAMLMGLSMVTTVAVLAYGRDPQRFRHAPWWVMVSLLALWFVHMLTITLVVSLSIILYILRPAPIRSLVRDWFAPVIVTLPFFFCLSLYYVRTLVQGKAGAIETPGLRNLAFALFEFFGFEGLGAPRAMLRLSPSFHTLLPYLGTVGLGVVALVILVIAILMHLRDSREGRTVFALSTALAAGLLFTLGLSFAANFRMLGRHVATFFPIFALLLLAGVAPRAKQNTGRLVLAGLLLLGIAWSVSDFRLRMLQSYQKDDYRDAAALAQHALQRGEAVLWLADTLSARYYGLPTTDGLSQGGTLLPGAPRAVSGSCSAAGFQQALQGHGPILVFVSDRPVFDPSGNCLKILESLNREHIASFPDFDVWQVNGVESNSGKS